MGFRPTVAGEKSGQKDQENDIACVFYGFSHAPPRVSVTINGLTIAITEINFLV